MKEQSDQSQRKWKSNLIKVKSSHIQVSSSPVILGAGLPISDVITALKAAAEAAPEEYGLAPTSVIKRQDA